MCKNNGNKKINCFIIIWYVRNSFRNRLWNQAEFCQLKVWQNIRGQCSTGPSRKAMKCKNAILIKNQFDCRSHVPFKYIQEKLRNFSSFFCLNVKLRIFSSFRFLRNPEHLNLRLIAQSSSCNRKIHKIQSFRWKFHQFCLLNLS